MARGPFGDRTFSQAWWPPLGEGVDLNDPTFDFDTASPWRVLVFWEEVEERMEPVEVRVLTVRPDLTGPVTAQTIREIPIGRLLRDARLDFVKKHSLPEAAWVSDKKPRLGLEHYEEVAEVYRAAYGTGSPTRAVREHFDVDQSTAAKYVARARNDYGLLPPAQKGKASI